MESKEGFLDRFLAKKMGTDEAFAARLISFSRQGHLCMTSEEGESPPLLPEGPIVCDEGRYYLRKNWDYETRLLNQIGRLMNRNIPSHSFEIAESQLQPEQIAAIRTSLAQSFTLICGGPGTGKTYTASLLVKTLAAHLKGPLYVALAAPTGKAAAHLKKTIGLHPQISITTSTLHRLLKKEGRIDADLVIVDEGSMIDLPLWVRLLESIGDETRLVILGDPDQLPPVEAGSIFAEMAPLLGVSLNRCMRTDVPELKELAGAILSGDVEQILKSVKLEESMDIGHLIERISPWMGDEEPDPKKVMNHYSRLGVLNALRQGPHGVVSLQQQIVEWMRGQLTPKSWWAIPILVTANEPRLELYNGTLGVMIGKGSASLTQFQGISYFPDESGTLAPHHSPPPIEPAFSLSVHKSQGSEFEEVIALFPKGSQRLGREALYTAVTRARKKLEIVGDEQTLREMVQSYARRESGFTQRLLRNAE